MVQDGVHKMRRRQDATVRDDLKEKRAAALSIDTRSLNGPIEGSPGDLEKPTVPVRPTRHHSNQEEMPSRAKSKQTQGTNHRQRPVMDHNYDT